MKSIFRGFVIVFALLNLIGCAKKLTEATLPIGIKPGSTYFTQVSLQYEKGCHLTTNYRKGALVPVNTQVQLREITSDDILLEILPSHTKFRI